MIMSCRRHRRTPRLRRVAASVGLDVWRVSMPLARPQVLEVLFVRPNGALVVPVSRTLLQVSRA